MPQQDEISGELDEPRPTVVEIDGVDVTNYVRQWLYERTTGDAIGSLKVELIKTVSNVVTIANVQTIEVWRWNEHTSELDKIFSGYIENIDNAGAQVYLTCKDKLWMLVRSEVVYSYDYDIDASAGKISEIFKDLVTTFGGLTADATSVQDSGTELIIKKFVCNHADVFERCKKLAEALDWQFYYRADTDKVYFEPMGFESNSNTITVGTDIPQIPRWRTDASELCNEITFIGSYQEVETTEYFNGDGSEDEFEVDYIPISTKVYVYVNPNWVLKAGAVEGYQGTYDYEVDKPNKLITFVTPPPSGTNNVQVAYSYAIPTPVVQDDEESIATYGRSSKTIFLSDVRRTDDAEKRAYNYLQKYASPFRYSNFRVISPQILDLQVGQKITVVDSINDINQAFSISRQIISFPSTVDEIYVGDREWRLAEWGAQTEERLHRLEEQSYEEQGVLLHVKNVGKNFRVRRKNITIYKIDTNNSFILGNAKLGYSAGNYEYVLGDDSSTSEKVYDKDYY